MATVSSEISSIRGRTSCMIWLALAVTRFTPWISAPARSTTTIVWSTTGRNRSMAGPNLAAAALMESSETHDHARGALRSRRHRQPAGGYRPPHRPRRGGRDDGLLHQLAVLPVDGRLRVAEGQRGGALPQIG